MILADGFSCFLDRVDLLRYQCSFVILNFQFAENSVKKFPVHWNFCCMKLGILINFASFLRTFLPGWICYILDMLLILIHQQFLYMFFYDELTIENSVGHYAWYLIAIIHATCKSDLGHFMETTNACLFAIVTW